MRGWERETAFVEPLVEIMQYQFKPNWSCRPVRCILAAQKPMFPIPVS